MKTENSIGLHASLITVLSMQFIAIFGVGLYDFWDFFISFICLLFSLRICITGYEDKLGRLLIASNLGISFVFSIFYPISYLVEFFQSLIVTTGLSDVFMPAEFLEDDAFGFLNIDQQSAITRGEVLALALIVVAWFLIRPRKVVEQKLERIETQNFETRQA